MKTKTPIQQIIDDLIDNNYIQYQNNKRWYDGLLEKEKQIIIDAAGEDYYNENFENYTDELDM